MVPDPALAETRAGQYDEIAEEYYDSERHPTCASLRELSLTFLTPKILQLQGVEQSLVEVGTGCSLLAPNWLARGGLASNLMLIDSSPAMLAHSTEWILKGVKSEVADASSIPVPDASVDVLVSSLGDPYNTAAFWLEVARVLRRGGIALFTTPSSEWASSFRPPNEIESAEFVRRDGAILMLPSHVPSEAAQLQMFSNAGLTLREVQSLTAGDLASPPAPKLLCVASGVPLLRGFTLVRETIAPPAPQASKGAMRLAAARWGQLRQQFRQS